MKSSFKKNAATQTAPETAQAPVENTERTLAQPQRGPMTAGAVNHKGRADMYGDWKAKDSKQPRVNVVQKSSGTELVKAFDLGDLILARKVKLADEKNAVTVVAIRSDKDYQQKTPFGEGQGVVYPTEEDVINNGGTTTYSKQAVADQIYFGPRAHIQFGIKSPETASEEDLNFFPFEHAGDKWTVGIITVASSGFTSLAKELETLRQYNKIMMNGLIFGLLELSTEFRTGKQGDWYVPVAKLTGPTDPGLQEFLLSISGN